MYLASGKMTAQSDLRWDERYRTTRTCSQFHKRTTFSGLFQTGYEARRKSFYGNLSYVFETSINLGDAD